MAVTLTREAARHLQAKLDKHGRAMGVRFGTRISGCTGYAYVVDYAEAINTEDHVFESHGIKVVVDPKSLPQINGMEVGFSSENLLNKGLEFNNPNVADSCGCGESFSLKP